MPVDGSHKVFLTAGAAWCMVGAAGVAWLTLSPLGVPMAFWIAAAVSWLFPALAMLRQWRNGYAYAMLLAIVYTVLGTMDVVAYGAAAWAAIAFSAAAFLAFFALIPATRLTRRRDTRE